MKLIRSFDTTQCLINVFDTEYEIDFYRIYCIKSFHRKNGKIVTRFGTKKQIDGIINTYHIEKEFKL